MNFTLKIWRQKDAKSKGAFESYKVENLSLIHISEPTRPY